MNVSPSRLKHLGASSFLLITLAAGGCTDDDPASSADAAAAPTSDAAVDGASTRSDAALADAAADAATFPQDSQVAPQILFSGAPSCDTAGLKLLGSIDSKPIDQTVPNPGGGSLEQAREISTYYGNESDGGALNNLRIDWADELTVGRLTPIRNGTLRNVLSSDPEAAYCVTKGQVAPTLEQPAQAVSLQFEVTEVQPSVHGECSGPKLAAALRGCVRWAVAF